MNQLLITDRFLPHRGGSRIYYYNICKNLEIPVLTGHEKDSKKFDPQQNFPIMRHLGIRPSYLGKYSPSNPYINLLVNYFPPAIIMLFWTFVYVAKLRPKIIHAGGSAFPGLAGLIINKCFRIPFIMYAHGEELRSQEDSRLFGGYIRWIFQSADKVIANSEFTKSLLLSSQVLEHRISVVNPGISEEFFDDSLETGSICKKYELEDKQVLLSVGRLTERKGHTQVIKALGSLISKYPNLRYVITGGGEKEGDLKKQVKHLNLNEYVIFTGIADDHEMLALYRICDVFILANRLLPKDVEGFGMVFLEAGAAGKPVIGGKSGGAIEAIKHGETGYLVDPEQVSQIADKIDTLLSDENLRKKMGENGKLWAKSFLWPNQIKKINSIIHEHL